MSGKGKHVLTAIDFSKGSKERGENVELSTSHRAIINRLAVTNTTVVTGSTSGELRAIDFGVFSSEQRMNPQQITING